MRSLLQVNIPFTVNTLKRLSKLTKSMYSALIPVISRFLSHIFRSKGSALFHEVGSPAKGGLRLTRVAVQRGARSEGTAHGKTALFLGHSNKTQYARHRAKLLHIPPARVYMRAC